MTEWTKGSRESNMMVTEIFQFIYSLFFFSAYLWIQHKVLHSIKKYLSLKRMECLLGPRHRIWPVLALRSYSIGGELNLIPCSKDSNQTASSLLSHQWEPKLFTGLPFLQLWKEFYNQLWSHFSKAESFRDALETARLGTFCFTCWATNIIFTLMKALLPWSFLGKKILFADQYLCIKDNSII